MGEGVEAVGKGARPLFLPGREAGKMSPDGDGGGPRVGRQMRKGSEC